FLKSICHVRVTASNWQMTRSTIITARKFCAFCMRSSASWSTSAPDCSHLNHRTRDIRKAPALIHCHLPQQTMCIFLRKSAVLHDQMFGALYQFAFFQCCARRIQLLTHLLQSLCLE